MKEIDPVCGMTVESQTATEKSEYMGKTYYFCCQSCKKEFEKNPEKFVDKEHKQEHHHH